MPGLKLLLVEDDRIVRIPVRDALEDAGYLVTECDDGAKAQRLLASDHFDVLLSDVRLPGVDGLSLFRLARSLQPAPAVVLMTAFADTDHAITAMREGVRDYVLKPFEMEELLLRLGAVRDEVQFRLRVGLARNQPADELAHDFVGKSPALVLARERIEAAAASEVSVLLLGEAGTGKDLAARLIHQRSARATKPFVAVNCAAIPDAQFESEMFGHEVGAVAGAERRRTGRIEAAHEGTLFLDELGALSLQSQSRLLRALESSRIEVLGASTPLRVDVRVIAAATPALAQQVAAGTFRSDLYYQLKVLDISLPSLRERRGDIPLLVARFLDDIARRQSRPLPSLSPEAAGAIAAHDYPGNVRELLHALERAVALARNKGPVQLEHLPVEMARLPQAHPADTGVRPLAEAVEQFERQYIERALEQSDGHRGRAASLLGISRKSLWERLRDAEAAPLKPPK
ncbi:MAG: sigma-54 dependent transcriptional regulator [Myxococcaceae bacterium]